MNRWYRRTVNLIGSCRYVCGISRTITAFAVLGLLFGIHGVCSAQELSSAQLRGWSDRVEQALRNGQTEEALKEMNQAVEAAPKQSQLYLMRGSLLFRSGRIDESLKDFDQCVTLEPTITPYLWQRGIALYYAGKYQDGLEQFERHREVNPNDVENAFWHFLCAVKLNGLEAAQKSVLLSGYDSRVPLMQVQELIQGKTTPQAIIDAVDKSSTTRRGPKEARFYGYLYVGLYYDAIGNTDEAKRWIEKCVEEKVGGYMGDVAKVHLEWMKSRDR